MIRLKGRAASILIGLISLVSISTASAGIHPDPEAVPGEYIVKMKPQLRVQNYSVGTLAQTLNAYVKNTIPDLNLVVIKKSVLETQKSVIQQLSQNPYVQYAEPNFIYRISRTPNDPMLGQLWGMQNTGAKDTQGQDGTVGMDIGATQAWDIETGSENTLIAVIDTGIGYNTPDLKDNVWTNVAELNGKAGIDDDNNGIIDDIHGANFSDAAKPTGDPLDDHGHGSHCSGTIGARGDDGQGLVGVNWKTKIMGVKFLTADGSGSLEGAVLAINYATKMGAKIMSNSWGGGGFSQALLDAIKASNAAGALFVAAAGNESNNNDSNETYPASYDVPNVLSVAAIDNKGQLASFSNYGKTKVHVGAPGVNIVSVTTAGYESWSGTSMATPHVSGIAGLLASHFPQMTGVEIKQRIISTAKPDKFLARKVSSNGVANAYTALTNQVPAPDMNDPSYWAAAQQNISSDHPYLENSNKQWTVSVPGAKEMSLYFAKLETEDHYDTVEVYDGTGKLVQTLSGNNDDTYTDIISGDTAKIVLKSDNSVNTYGFDLTKISYR